MLSIIVPVYNAERYINKCVDSILSQSYNDFELILVDDGSTDSSGTICDDYAKNDSRINVFHQQNMGVSSARNLGIEKASGDWIMFVDSDDWIESDCLEVCSKFFYGNLDLIVFSCKWAADSRVPDMLCNRLSDFKTILPQYIDKIIFVTPWCKLFKRKIIEDLQLRFDESISSGEDTLFSLEYLNKVHSMQLISNEFYHYVIENNENSLSKIKDVDWLKETYCLCRLFSVISNIETTFDVNLGKMRCLLCESKINKYLYILASFSLFKVRKGLKLIVESKELDYIFVDKRYMPKGERRKMIDVLVKYKLITLLAFYIKYIRAEY